MDAVDKTRRLHIVPRAQPVTKITPAISASPNPGLIQGGLFPAHPELLVFVFFPAVTEKQFSGALEEIRPAAIFDLRPAPRFDIGRLDRREVLRMFNQVGARYFDFGTALGVEGCADPTLFDSAIGDSVSSEIKAAFDSGRGPFMIFLNEAITSRSAIDSIAGTFTARKSWTLQQIPDEQPIVERPALIAL